MITASDRKRAQRQRDKELGITTLTLRLDAQELAMVLEGCEQRRIARQPYEVTEFLVSLIRQDNKLLHKQLAELRKSSCSGAGIRCQVIRQVAVCRGIRSVGRHWGIRG